MSTVHGATALALNAIIPVHCPPPAYKPASKVQGTIKCTVPACSGTIRYTVFTSGSSAGRCTTAGCLKWVQ